MKIKVLSLGCRLNQSEIQSVITVLTDRGHEIVEAMEADLYIINSCRVTHHSERKTRKFLYRALAASEKRNDRSRIIVTGCFSDDIIADGNVIFISNDHKYLIPDIIENKIMPDHIGQCAASRFSFSPPLKATRTRIDLKIQDGCDSFCSYCIIPHMRGMPVSKPADQVMREFVQLIDGGCKEIILTGVMIGKYNHEGLGLDGLVRGMLDVPGRFRVHLPSISPDLVSDGLMDILGHDKMVKHMNISLQSGSDAILKKMNRKYTRKEYLSITKKIKNKIPDFNFTTDLIVGFPGEEEADFRDSVDLVKEVGFSHIHTFRYSPRPGTAAAAFSETVAEETKTSRSREIIALYSSLKKAYYLRFDNRECEVLSEKSRGGKTRGFNEYYVPVEMDTVLQRNRFYKIITSVVPENDRLAGRIYKPSDA